MILRKVEFSFFDAEVLQQKKSHTRQALLKTGTSIPVETS